MIIDDDYVIRNCFTKTGALNRKKFNNIILNDISRTYLINRYDDIPRELFSFKEVVIRIKNNINVRPVCPICGKPVKFNNKFKNARKNFFITTCENRDCKSKNLKNKVSNTVTNNYKIFTKIKNDIENINTYSQEEILIYKQILQGIETKNNVYKCYNFVKKLITDKKLDVIDIQKLYPDEYEIYTKLSNNLINVKNKNTQLKNDYDKIVEKISNHEIIDYQSTEYKNYLIFKAHKENTSKTLKRNYQDYVFVLSIIDDYSIDEIIKLYPNEYINYVSYSKKFESNKKRFSNYKFILEKIFKDNLSKDECEKIYPNEFNDYVKCSNTNDKIIETFRKNKTFNTTKPEKELLDYLSKLYPDIEHQFKDDVRYPFNCDFYIPSLDLFIEYHGSHFHCNKPFDNDDENDLNKLNDLMEKSQIKHQQSDKTNQYDMMIYTWTALDVRKREYMIKNNLKFLIYYELPTFDKLKNDIDKFKE